MIPKGLGDIKGLRSINNKPGPLTNKDGFLRLYQLSAEKDSLKKKLEWVNRQKAQTEKRIATVAEAIHTIEHQTHRALISDTYTEVRHPFIEY